MPSDSRRANYLVGNGYINRLAVVLIVFGEKIILNISNYGKTSLHFVHNTRDLNSKSYVNDSEIKVEDSNERKTRTRTRSPFPNQNSL